MIRAASMLVVVCAVTASTARAQSAPSAPDAGAAPVDAGAPAAPTGPRTFAIDGKHSVFVLQVFKDGAAATFAHDHTIQASEIAGTVVADPAALEQSKVNVTVQTKTLVNDDPNTRKQFGLDPTIPEKDRKTIEEHMKDDSQLDVAKFPTIGFASTSVEKNGDKLTLVGDFTLHGVTKKMRMPISFKLSGATLTGDGKVRFLQSDWGIKPYSALLGAVKNKDEVVLNVHLVAVCP